MASWKSTASLAVVALALFGHGAAAMSDDVCTMEPFVVGLGKAAIPRWSYEASSGVCRQFLWGGGVPVNGNNFETLEDCLTACNLACTDDDACDGFPSTPLGQQQEDKCLETCNDCIDKCNLEQPPNDGKAQVIKQECVEECIVLVNEPETCWSYDESAGICTFSTPGGCDNTGNKFETLKLCMSSGAISQRCVNKCALFPEPADVNKCLATCNDCIDGCNLEQPPNDGQAQVIKQACIDECVPDIECSDTGTC